MLFELVAVVGAELDAGRVAAQHWRIDPDDEGRGGSPHWSGPLLFFLYSTVLLGPWRNSEQGQKERKKKATSGPPPPYKGRGGDGAGTATSGPNTPLLTSTPFHPTTGQRMCQPPLSTELHSSPIAATGRSAPIPPQPHGESCARCRRRDAGLVSAQVVARAPILSSSPSASSSVHAVAVAVDGTLIHSFCGIYGRKTVFPWSDPMVYVQFEWSYMCANCCARSYRSTKSSCIAICSANFSSSAFCFPFRSLSDKSTTTHSHPCFLKQNIFFT